MPAQADTLDKYTMAISNVGMHTATCTITLLDDYPDGATGLFSPLVQSIVGWGQRYPFTVTIPSGSVLGDTVVHQMTGLTSGSWIIALPEDTGVGLYQPSTSGAANVESVNGSALATALLSLVPGAIFEWDYLTALRDVTEARVIYYSATSNWSLEVDYFPGGTTDTVTLVDHGSATDLADCGVTVSSAPVEGTTTITMNPTWAAFQTTADNSPKTATVTQWEQLMSVLTNGNEIMY